MLSALFPKENQEKLVLELYIVNCTFLHGPPGALISEFEWTSPVTCIQGSEHTVVMLQLLHAVLSAPLPELVTPEPVMSEHPSPPLSGSGLVQYLY